jgi:hypothetical protein
VLAYAKIFMASAAVALNVAGVVIVGASGQRIMITLGLSVGSISWMESSSAAVMAPDASTMGEDWDKAELAFRLGPVSESLPPDGPDLCGLHVRFVLALT